MAEELAIEQADFYWRPINLGFEGYHKLNKREKHGFVFNHFEILNLICTKTRLIKSLRNYYDGLDPVKRENYSIFDSTPTTFIISRASDDRDVHLFLQRFRENARGGSHRERLPFKHCE